MYRKPPWRLQPSGGVAALVAAAGDAPPEGSAVLRAASLKMVFGERGYDLPKRLMFGNVLGLIFAGSQFTKGGRPLHCGVLLFRGLRRQPLATGGTYTCGCATGNWLNTSGCTVPRLQVLQCMCGAPDSRLNHRTREFPSVDRL